jgi:archaeal flagellar protein FlaG
MDKAIITVLLIICGITATLAIINGIMPAINQSQSAISGAAEKASDRIGSRIEIIQASSSGTEVSIWVKNVGNSIIYDIPQSDVFFGDAGTYNLISYGDQSVPGWNYAFAGTHDQWGQTVNICVTIRLTSFLNPGAYMVKMVIPNGISDEMTFSKS